MGLAASQARLLTITSRKSRAQFENMRFSHQKLALSRSLTDLSNEYQKSLDQTKLYYDFYGVNSTDTPLTYNMLMSASSINDYTPTLITNNQGQMILSTPYAQAARAAGIPMEGLGCQPSSVIREAFILGLAANGIITEGTASAILAVDYNQGAGLGASNLINTQTTYGNFDTLLDIMKDGGSEMCLSSDLVKTAGNAVGNAAIAYLSGETPLFYAGQDLSHAPDKKNSEHNISNLGVDGNTYLTSVNFSDIISGAHHLYVISESDDRDKDHGISNYHTQYDNMLNTVYNVIGKLATILEKNIVGATDAINYATLEMQTNLGATVKQLIEKGNGKTNSSGHTSEEKQNKAGIRAVSNASGYLGLANVRKAGGTPWLGKKQMEAVAALDLTDFVRGWFTYFMQYMHGLGSAESNNLHVAWGSDDSNSTFATADNLQNFQFTFSSTAVNDNQALIANHYDTLFNQICMSGWCENSQIDKDSNYLKEMLQTGMMYVTSISDDYHYYQNNYSTNSFIKEVADEAAVAAAESKYTTEKARINAKEQELDLKMKNLDTEISSLETEYEAVKKVIENNASKAFTRYDG